MPMTDPATFLVAWIVMMAATFAPAQVWEADWIAPELAHIPMEALGW